MEQSISDARHPLNFQMVLGLGVLSALLTVGALGYCAMARKDGLWGRCFQRSLQGRPPSFWSWLKSALYPYSSSMEQPGRAAIFLIVLPLIGVGLLYWNGRLKPRNLAVLLALGLPLVTLILAGIEPAIRVSQRLDDDNLKARLVHGNGVDLIWPPDGPGWPREGGDWHEANRVCKHLR